MTASVATLIPPKGLVVANPTAGKPPLFALFTKDWLKMQSFVMQTLALPITTGNFTTKYGTFSDQSEIENVVAAMKSIQALSTEFGDPKSLMAQLASNPGILQSPTAPKEIYTHIVWFADQLYHSATSFNQTLGAFMEVLNPANCGTPEACGEVLKDLLVGKGGLQSTANDMTEKANALVSALAGFNLKLSPSVDTMTTYTGSSCKFYNDVVEDIGQDAANITTYQNAAAKAYKQWEDYTISAVTTSVGVMVFSAGLAWPVAAGLAGGLGAAAAEARKAYDKAEDKLHAAKKDKQQKMLLQNDLGGLNAMMPETLKASQDFLKTLQQVTAVWTQTAGNLNYIATNFTMDKLGDLSWIRQALGLDQATKDWQTIADVTKNYTSNSLVTFSVGTFGKQLPVAA